MFNLSDKKLIGRLVDLTSIGINVCDRLTHIFESDDPKQPTWVVRTKTIVIAFGADEKLLVK